MPLRLEDIINYRGDLQPDRWSLHPEDFRIRMDWEYDRQRILNAQAHSIEKKLPYPTEKIPPIPRLKHPEYAARRRTQTITPTITQSITITQKPQSTITSPETKEERAKRLNRDRVARNRAKKPKNPKKEV